MKMECVILRDVSRRRWLKALSAFLVIVFVNESHVGATGEKYVQPPSPAFPLTCLFNTIKFSEGFSNLWGAEHQNVSQDDITVTLKIDRYSGGGFKSKKPYMYGFFNAALKLQAGYTAGIITTFYMSNNQVYPNRHDELDFEFLGTIPGEPYKLQTNVYGNGTGDGNVTIGREQQFHLWFDPTEDFHNYSILWTPHHIVFFVDSVPIRRFPYLKELGFQYPSKPMSIYATLWDGSSWATDGGKYKANYSYEPFLATYTKFIITACEDPSDDDAHRHCWPSYLDLFVPSILTKSQQRGLDFVRKNYMTYDYCQDVYRYPNGLPECHARSSKSSPKLKPAHE